MSELIDREAVREFIKSYSHSTDVVYHMEKHLYEVPTIEAVPVVHGEWIFQGTGGSMGTKTCSVCGYQSWQSKMRMDNMGNYCPKCGARMGERREE